MESGVVHIKCAHAILTVGALFPSIIPSAFPVILHSGCHRQLSMSYELLKLDVF